MKRINKGLLYEQYYSLKLVTILLALITAVYSFIVSKQKIRQISFETEYYQTLYNFLINRVNIGDLMCISLVVAILLVCSYGINKGKSMLFLGAAPTSRKQIIYSRTLSVFISTCLILFVDLYVNIFVSLKYRYYLEYFNSSFLSTSFLRTLILLSAAICLIAIFTLAQIVVNNGILSGAFGFYMLLYPFIMIIGISSIIGEGTGTYIHAFEEFIGNVRYTEWGVEFKGALGFLEKIIGVYNIKNTILWCVIAIVVALLFFKFIDVNLFKRVSLENRVKVFVNNIWEKIIIILTTILITIWGSFFLSIIITEFSYNYSYDTNGKKIFLIMPIILIYPCYFILKKIVYLLNKKGI